MTCAAPALDILTVSEYATRLGRAVRQVGGAVIEGEVQRPRRSAGGALWFSLSDGEATLSCKVFRAQSARLEHDPREGDLVQAEVERPDLWAQSGKLDLIVVQLRLAGEGELLRRRRELLERLTAEGLCAAARRRCLPRFPRAVGVIAGAGSDAMSDVLCALRDRWPAVHVVTCASVVQGSSAPLAVIDALARLQQHPLVDVIVLARGGGSVNDLACFDDERLCRALFACALPVVCAIGHTDNNPVCNHVAWAAFTPSRSAELVVPSAGELRRQIAGAGEQLGAARHRLALARERVDGERARLQAAPRRLELVGERVAASGAQLQRSARRLGEAGRGHDRLLARFQAEARAGVARRLRSAHERLAREAERARELAFARLRDAERDLCHESSVIAARDFRPRGWLLASHADGRPVRSACELAPGEGLELRLHDGHARATVFEVDRDQEEHRG